MKYRATYTTTANITVTVEATPDLIAQHTHDGEVDWDAIEDWAHEESHRVAEAHIETWGTYQPVLLDASLDGIGADEVETIDTPGSPG